MAWTNLYDGTKISASFKVSSRKARRPFSLPVWFMLRHNKEPLETRAARYASAFGFGVPYETFLVWLLQLRKISCLFSETSNKKSLSQWVLRCKGKKKKKKLISIMSSGLSTSPNSVVSKLFPLPRWGWNSPLFAPHPLHLGIQSTLLGKVLLEMCLKRSPNFFILFQPTPFF